MQGMESENLSLEEESRKQEQENVYILFKLMGIFVLSYDI